MGRSSSIKITRLFTELKSQIEKIISPTDKEWRTIESAFVFREVPKKFELVKEGDIANEIYYIKKGLMRLFYRKEGEEFTAFLFTEHLFSASFESFLRQSPSIQCLETLEECELLVLGRDDLLRLYEEVPKMNILTRTVTEQRFVNAQQILSSYILDTPEERYLKFATQHKNLLQRVPQHIIASFLGITPVSLSRIRARITEK